MFLSIALRAGLLVILLCGASASTALAQQAPDLFLEMHDGQPPTLHWSNDQHTLSSTVQAGSTLASWEDLTDQVLAHWGGRFEDRQQAGIQRRFYRLLTREESAQEALVRNGKKWESKGLTDYRFTFQWFCFCPPDYAGPVTITVSNSQISRVVRAGIDLPPNEFDQYHTIEGLFDFLEEALAFEADAFRFQFDAECGYPDDIFIDYLRWAVDDEKGFAVQDLRSLTELPPVTITDEPPVDLQLDSFTLREARLAGDVLTLSVEYGGGCREHDFALFMSPSVFAESFPVQASLYVRHQANGDLCRALIRRDVQFNIRPILDLYQRQYHRLDPIILNVFEYFVDQPAGSVSVRFVP